MKYHIPPLDIILSNMENGRYGVAVPAAASILSSVRSRYIDSAEAGNELINFCEPSDFRVGVSSIVDELKRLGVKEFTISYNGSGLMADLAEFEVYGAKLDGMTTVFRDKDFYSSFDNVPKALAIRLKIA